MVVAVMMIAMVAMVMRSGGEDRAGKHKQKQGRGENLLHANILALS